MQKLRLFLLFLLLPFSDLFSQEKSETQEFVDLLMSSRLFDAFDYYEKYGELINNEDSVLGKTLYNAFKNIALNEYDTSVPYFDAIFGETLDDSKYPLLALVSDFSFNSHKYADSAYLFGLLNKLDSIYSLDNNDENTLDRINHNAKMRELCTLLQHEEEAKICFRDSSSIVDFDQSYDVPIIQVQANQRITKALFDTGVSFPLVIVKQTADSIGVRIVHSELMMPINNIQTPVAYGILDSLTIDNLTAYNLFTLILDMDLANHANSIDLNAFNHGNMEIMIGLPFMKQMGTISLDLENEKLTLTAKDDDSKDDYNMLLYKGNLYLRAAINNIPHTGFIDTGSSRNEITLNNDLYNKYKNELETVKSSYIDTTTLITHKDIRSLGIIENLKWSLVNQDPVVDIAEQSRVRLDTNNQEDYYDAFYGFRFMQRFKKVIFDFNKMEFSYIMK